MARARRPRTPKPCISYVFAMCRGGGCAAKVLVLTGGMPVDADHMITTILMILAKPRGEVRRPGVADEPVVVVKRPAVDLHGDMRRGENRLEALFVGESRQEWRRRGEHKSDSATMRSQRNRG